MVSRPRRSEQIPFVPGDVEEDGEAAVWFVTRLSQEDHTMVDHALLSCVEVLDTKEQPHTSGVLVADHFTLLCAVGLSEEQAGLRSGWFYDDPSLRASVIGRRRRILNEFKPQRIDEESDGVVVVFDDQRSVLDVHVGRRHTNNHRIQ